MRIDSEEILFLIFIALFFESLYEKILRIVNTKSALKTILQ